MGEFVDDQCSSLANEGRQIRHNLFTLAFPMPASQTRQISIPGFGPSRRRPKQHPRSIKSRSTENLDHENPD
uniref:Uncharacterized protein n=1 Tax=Panagrellus redivivus TaxID=6233 RepID=A0A7E4VUG5_PANRE